MAKSSNGESKARTVPARRRAAKGTGNPVARAPEMAATASAGRPSPDEVRRRAYELYLQRGGTHGRALEDWLEAERQVAARTTH